jgi:hypothetical protein
MASSGSRIIFSQISGFDNEINLVVVIMELIVLKSFYRQEK